MKKLAKEIDQLESTWDEVDNPCDTLRYIIESAADRLAKTGVNVYDLIPQRMTLRAGKSFLAECRKSDSLTPPQVARLLKVNPDKVLTWIRSGKLHAVNVTVKPGGRPRYRIAMSDLEAFRKPSQKVAKKPLRKPYVGKTYY